MNPARPGVGVAVAQVSQGEQGLPAGIEAPPPGSAPATMPADDAGEVVQSASGSGIPKARS
jgi:hypothetical protein